MGTYRIATGVAVGNPVRPKQTWNASLRSGDDLKLALTVYGENGEPAAVRGSFSRLSLVADDPTIRLAYDMPVARSGDAGIPGAVTGVRPGGINFLLPRDKTPGLREGRYRLGIRINLLDGTTTQIQGILQVRPSDGVQVEGAASYFQLDRSPLDGDEPLADAVMLGGDGVPLDVDGFPATGSNLLPGSPRPDSEYLSPILGAGLARWMVLADGRDTSTLGAAELRHIVLAADPVDSPFLGVSTAEHMILAESVEPPPVETGTASGFVADDGAVLVGSDGAILLPII